MGNSGKSKYRHNQNEALMLNILNNCLKYEINDPELKNASFTYVQLSGDKSYLNVYVDTWDLSKMEHLITELNNAKGIFRKALADHTNFYKVPHVEFFPDKTIQENIKIQNLLNKIKKE